MNRKPPEHAKKAMKALAKAGADGHSAAKAHKKMGELGKAFGPRKTEKEQKMEEAVKKLHKKK